MAEDVPGDVAGGALEDVAGLDQAQLGADLEAMGGGDRGGRLLGPFQRAGQHRDQRRAREVTGQQLGLGPPTARQLVPGQPPVQHPARVLHLPVADQVDDGLGHALILEIWGRRL
jgi:hypothetical protein